LTQSLAQEVARLNITVNAICPGFRGHGGAWRLSVEDANGAEAKIPMRRFGPAGRSAAAIVFWLVLSSYITSSILKVDAEFFSMHDINALKEQIKSLMVENLMCK